MVALRRLQTKTRTRKTLKPPGSVWLQVHTRWPLKPPPQTSQNKGPARMPCSVAMHCLLVIAAASLSSAAPTSATAPALPNSRGSKSPSDYGKRQITGIQSIAFKRGFRSPPSSSQHVVLLRPWMALRKKRCHLSSRGLLGKMPHRQSG